MIKQLELTNVYTPQIISLQTLHYLLLTLIIPPLVTLFTDGSALTYAGGSYNKGYVLDWREIASRTTAKSLPREPPTVEKRVLTTAVWGEADSRAEGIESLAFTAKKSADVHTYVRRSLSKRENEHYAVKDEKDDDFEVWDYGVSRRRGWVLAGTWLLICTFE